MRLAAVALAVGGAIAALALWLTPVSTPDLGDAAGQLSCGTAFRPADVDLSDIDLDVEAPPCASAIDARRRTAITVSAVTWGAAVVLAIVPALQRRETGDAAGR